MLKRKVHTESIDVLAINTAIPDRDGGEIFRLLKKSLPTSNIPMTLIDAEIPQKCRSIGLVNGCEQ